MAISPARLSAFDILLKIDKRRGFSSELLAASAEDLEERDRSLCHELVLGVLRRQIYLDRIVHELSNGKKLDLEVRISLRMGLYQLIYLDRIPAYSAIDEAVELVRRAKKTSAKGFVNAILRRFDREPRVPAYRDEFDRISLETSHPRWLVEKWTGDFGVDQAESIAKANNERPPIGFRLTSRHRLENADDFAHSFGLGADPSSNVRGCYIAEEFSTKLRDLEARGLIYFQDEASQMVAGLIRPNVGQRFLDVCASPGGKTAQIADHADIGGTLCLIVAGDVSENRVSFLRQNCAAQGVENVNVVRYDAEIALPFADASFDLVLVDAPCSGTGTIRHNPEIRYGIESKDFAALAHKQLCILVNAAKLLVPGGSLIYSTCSLEKEENEDVVRGFLATTGQFTIGTPDVPERFVTTDGFVRTVPSRDNMDGFFVALLTKSNE